MDSPDGRTARHFGTIKSVHTNMMLSFAMKKSTFISGVLLLVGVGVCPMWKLGLFRSCKAPTQSPAPSTSRSLSRSRTYMAAEPFASYDKLLTSLIPAVRLDAAGSY